MRRISSHFSLFCQFLILKDGVSSLRVTYTVVWMYFITLLCVTLMTTFHVLSFLMLCFSTSYFIVAI